MKLVLLFFCFLIGLLFLIIVLLMFSSIKLNVKECDVSNVNGGIKLDKFSKKIEISIGIYLFSKVKILSIKITDSLIDKLKKQRIIKFNEKMDISKLSKTFELIKNLHIKTEKFKLNLEIGNSSVMITSYLVMIISSIISIILRNDNYHNIYFKVYPNYNNTNVIRLNLSCIISVKIVYIFKLIFMFMKYKTRQKIIDNRYLKFI